MKHKNEKNFQLLAPYAEIPLVKNTITCSQIRMSLEMNSRKNDINTYYIYIYVYS